MKQNVIKKNLKIYNSVLVLFLHKYADDKNKIRISKSKQPWN